MFRIFGAWIIVNDMRLLCNSNEAIYLIATTTIARLAVGEESRVND